MVINDTFLAEADWLEEHREEAGLLVVDTRGPQEFESAHVPGAVSLPSVHLFDSSTVGSDLLPVDELERRLGAAGIDNETKLVLYDDSGLVPSARVFWVLENLGRGNMALLNGGFMGWASRGFPVESGTREPDPVQFRATASRAALATREDVLDAVEREDALIIDTRSPEEYAGTKGEHQRNGHIPGAVNIEWQHHIKDLFDPTFVSEPELRSLYEAVGAHESDEVITYCRTASRSSHTYFVLRMLGFERVRNYSGSWTEWNVDESLPIEQG
jgi:thiosulfate/3-mercaptopyruvate sulfurtransferase